jgi:two-component system, OmpR family, sensor kinase
VSGRWRRWGPLVALPAVVGCVAAVVARVQAPTSNVFVETRLWIAAALCGVVGSGALAARGVVAGLVVQARAAGAEEASQAALRDHQRFLLRLDHELKNPVTAIRAGLANLAPSPGGLDGGGPTTDPAAARALESISTQTRRLADLVADLRKLAELETRPLERFPVDLGDLLDEINEAACELPAAGDRTVTLSLPQAPWPVGTVPGDRDLLFLALHNLVVNAIKFSGPGDTIEVRARDDGDHVVVEVADTGIGIPDDEVGQIWDELARGSAARGTPGMGLGLAMVRVVVSRHGGTVGVRSRAGDGTVIGVRLPTA